MSYSQIANSEIDASSPITETLLTKFRDNIRDHVHGASDVGSGLKPYTVGDYVLHGNSTTRTTDISTYTKVKETKILRSGNFRITFKLWVDIDSGYATVYKNGTAIGTERSTNSTSPVLYSEDFNGLAEGDLIQVYAKKWSGGSAVVSVSDLNICCAEEGINYSY